MEMRKVFIMEGRNGAEQFVGSSGGNAGVFLEIDQNVKKYIQFWFLGMAIIDQTVKRDFDQYWFSDMAIIDQTVKKDFQAWL